MNSSPAAVIIQEKKLIGQAVAHMSGPSNVHIILFENHTRDQSIVHRIILKCISWKRNVKI